MITTILAVIAIAAVAAYVARFMLSVPRLP
jgi:hypothetical protein